MHEYYKILGLEDGASLEEVESAYNRLKAKYSKDRFLEGEVGNIAAKKLTEVENAYSEITSFLKKTNEDNSKNNYDEVENLLKNEKYNEAQDLLDNYIDRDAEWHYLQSVVFYKKNWINESLKQLEIAVNLDSSNVKYKEAYEKLKLKISNNDRQFRSGNANFNDNGENVNRQMGGDGASDCCSWCTTMCCMNLACNLCCNCR